MGCVNEQQKKKKKKKRSYDQMSEDANEQILEDLNSPRKKLKTLNEQKQSESQQKRRSRKRKFMSEDDSDLSIQQTKKRRLTTISSTSSLIASPIARKTQKRSRKRKFGEVFLKNENDEDDDVKSEDKMLIDRGRPLKRMRMDTPFVNRKKYFDPIHLHNEFCPYRNEHTYNSNDNEKVYGWMHAIKLLPNDVVYIQQLAAEQAKGKR